MKTQLFLIFLKNPTSCQMSFNVAHWAFNTSSNRLSRAGSFIMAKPKLNLIFQGEGLNVEVFMWWESRLYPECDPVGKKSIKLVLEVCCPLLGHLIENWLILSIMIPWLKFYFNHSNCISDDNFIQKCSSLFQFVWEYI